MIFGARADVLAHYNIRSSPHVGHPWIALMLGLAAAMMTARLAVVRRVVTVQSSLAVYLLLVGLQAALVPLLLPESGGMLIRYALLSLFLPVGAAAYYLRREVNALARAGFMMLLVVWSVAGAMDHVRLLHEYVTRPPANTFRELAIHLENQGHRYGWLLVGIPCDLSDGSTDRARAVRPRAHPARPRSRRGAPGGGGANPA